MRMARKRDHQLYAFRYRPRFRGRCARSGHPCRRQPCACVSRSTCARTRRYRHVGGVRRSAVRASHRRCASSTLHRAPLSSLCLLTTAPCRVTCTQHGDNPLTNDLFANVAPNVPVALRQDSAQHSVAAPSSSDDADPNAL